MLDLAKKWRARVDIAGKEAHSVLAKHEISYSRVVHLENLLESISDLPADVYSLFHEAVICIEYDLKKAGIVYSWSGFISILSRFMYKNYLKKLKKHRGNWDLGTLESFREEKDYQLIETAQKVGLINKNQERRFKGNLTKRNQCAHPTTYVPTRNVAIGYVDEMINDSKQYI